jgi:hypothetical protein
MYGYAGGAVTVSSGASIVAVVPDATIAAGGWTDQDGGSAAIHLALADDDPNTWAQSPPNPQNATLKLGLSNFSPGGGPVGIEIHAQQVP